MAEYAIQIKGWQMGTWFAVNESELIEQLKLMLQSTKGSKVKVRLDKTGLKVTKMSTFPLMGSEKMIELPQIKNMFTDPKFPLCFFCTTCGPDGYLLKVIVIRCRKEMCATGIVNYYRTLTYKKRINSDEMSETKKINNATSLKVISGAKDENKKETVTDAKVINNGYFDANDEEVERITLPIEREKIVDVLNADDEAVPVKANGIETKERDIKSLSKDVEAIQLQTLKKHPATISRQEYIDIHEKVYALETELSRQRSRTIDTPSKNPRHYSIIIPQMKKSRNIVDNGQLRHQRFLSVNKGKFLPVSKTRVQIVNDNFVGNTMKIQKQQRPNSILLPEKENQTMKASRLSAKSRQIPDVTADSNVEQSGPIPGKNNVKRMESQEPIYAQVVKNRQSIDAIDHSNGDAKLHANSSEHDTSAELRIISTPPVPLRTVTFKNWAMDMQKRPSKKVKKVAVRPHSYHQPVQLSSPDRVWNTHDPKPIEMVYNRSGTLSRSLNLKEYYRPRVDSNSFKDIKHLVTVYQAAL